MIFKRGSTSGWEDRLDREVGRLLSAQRYRELTLKRIKDLVGAPNESVLLDALAEKVSTGDLHVFYRVISPSSMARLADFSSPLDVPETMLDESTGEEVAIDPYRNVEAVFVAEAAIVQ